jgi:hypothetical protein
MGSFVDFMDYHDFIYLTVCKKQWITVEMSYAEGLPRAPWRMWFDSMNKFPSNRFEAQGEIFAAPNIDFIRLSTSRSYIM